MTHGAGVRREPVTMMNGMMNGMMMGGWLGLLIGLLVLVVLILGIAALIKYLRS